MSDVKKQARPSSARKEDESAVPTVAFDSRSAWFEEKVLSALKIKSDKWKKTISLPECMESITLFLDSAAIHALIFYLNSKDDLIISSSFPSSLKKKSVYFMKKSPGSISELTDSTLIFGDLPANPLEYLSSILEEVYMPLLSNPKNFDGIPSVVASEVLKQFHNLNGAVHIITGKSKAKTVLPIPEQVKSCQTDAELKVHLHLFESSVITWIHSVQELFNQSSASTNDVTAGPIVEIEFWEARATNMTYLHDQLTGETIQKIGKTIENAGSSYFSAFKIICADVEEALAEAVEVSNYMKYLRTHVDKLVSPNDFEDLRQIIPALLYTVYLISRESKYFCTPLRLNLMIRSIANELINQTRQFIDVGEIFSGEPEESLVKLKIAIRMLDHMNEAYSICKDKSMEAPINKHWNFDTTIAFSRLESFTSRVRKIAYLFETLIDFNKIEKIEIGNSKGRILSTHLMQIFTDFNTRMSSISKSEYDLLDLKETRFESDYAACFSGIEDLESRIGTVISQAFDDTPCLYSCFRLIESFGQLATRKLVKKDFEPKYFVMLSLFSKDLNDVSIIFNTHKDSPPIHSNMAPLTGALSWIHELKDRIKHNFERFQGLPFPVFETERGVSVVHQYNLLSSTLDTHFKYLFDKWAITVDSISEENLNKPLLCTDNGIVKVNFDPKIVALLREVHYLNQLGVEVPSKAAKIYSNSDIYRKYIFQMDSVCNLYNSINTSVLSVERPLLEGRFTDIDAIITNGSSAVTWNSSSIETFIGDFSTNVSKLSSILQAVKNNVQNIQKLLKSWATTPFYERRDPKKSMNLDDREARFDAINSMIKRDGQAIHENIGQVLSTFGSPSTSEAWTQYLRYLDQMVGEGFLCAIKNTLSYLNDNMERSKQVDAVAFLESKIELDNDKLVFTPEMSEESNNSISQIFKEIVENSINTAALVARVLYDPKEAELLAIKNQKSKINASEDLQQMTTEDEVDEFEAAFLKQQRELEQQTYLGTLMIASDIEELKHTIYQKISVIVDDCQAYRENMQGFSYLWVENRQDYIRRVINPENNTTSDNLKLDRFESEIKKFELVHKSVMAMETDVLMQNWYKIDAKPLKNTLNVVVKKWTYSLSKHLSDEVMNSLEELNSFVQLSRKGLSDKYQEGDYHGLIHVMGLLHSIKERSANVDTLFEPLRKTIGFLKNYGFEMPEESMKLLNDLPEQWSEVKKLSVSIKDHVAPLQAKEVDNLQQKCNTFESKNHTFREEFRKKAPFKFDVGPGKAYETIDINHFEVLKMETESITLQNSCQLFELSVPTYKQMQDCRRDIGLLKSVWDVVALVTYMFDSWKETLWEKIDTDSLEGSCRDLSKELKRMDKEIKGWDVYSGLDQMVKDMVTSLRAVGELRSNAIRERHWKQLMKATGVTFTLTQDMKFKDLLSLQLHRFEDDVKGIVDRATKELSMEKVINEISTTWSTMELTYDYDEVTKTALLRSSEELVECLEDNQVLLQNMMTSKYVAHFESQISKWQTTLGIVDSVLHLWLEIQKTWSHLESIFMGSEDIRQQLPEDTKSFIEIDTNFKALMKTAASTPNCVEACTKEGLFDRLEIMQSELALREKALAEYLETKRLAFPRFYFVSGSDLLDILAKGNMPELVAVHLAKLFDSMSRLEFKKDSNGENTNVAIGMYSKEDEYVSFVNECECVGPVEHWLTRLEESMIKTLKASLGESVVAYEEKPREQWIFDFPAQISLAGTMIWWTTEVNAAFAKLEEGFENALKDYYKKQVIQLTNLIQLIQGDLSSLNRQMIMTICTLDVHARDMVAKLIFEKADNSMCFSWQSQLRFKWDEIQNDCFINIADAHFRYNYEYLGNTPRLVVTALTDRCYITLTQALHLVMGGAPAGPAGTGKTETTKDLGKALGIMVYVFNCSEQMDYQSIGNIFKGLAQSGTCGCFDEFNRISVEVLSVVATQVKSIQDAIRSKKKRFIFQGEEISLKPTIGIFITMNPGYAGRTELPENIKALFRPCSMVVPNFELIMEIMLMAEGFVEANILARKFNTLYKLNKELLSKQDHYDWGLRAIKSVLVVAGSLKRSDTTVAEEHVLMRALRDFNIPKIVIDDLQIFNGLIGDLFPKIEVARKRNEKLEEDIRKATVELGLQPEDIFILKIVQLEELLAVRHSVFIIGNAGTGKSQIWKTLARTYQNNGRKCLTPDLNPKAVTTDELFGCINASTREWKDGLFSSIMRDTANLPGTDPKWILLDGDIDPNWIESLNTVMDDNKMLTLASNERIPLKPHMRLIFEINDLKYATPATVSRAGILYLNSSDLGWNPYVQSWLDKRDDASEKSTLALLFDRYVNLCLDQLKSGRFKTVKVEEFSLVCTLCNLLEGLLTIENVPKGCDKEWYEVYFVFAAIWAFGGPIIKDQAIDYRAEFSKWWTNEFKAIKLPTTGSIFDFYIDHATKQFLPWSDMITSYTFDPEMPLANVLVHTQETTRIKYLLNILADNGKPVLLVGAAGCGKTVLMQDKLGQYGEDRLIVNVPFNFYTNAFSLQNILEKPLEKKAGRNYGPPGAKKIIYFLDDLNMPEVDKYGTASPHTLLRQYLDYHHWYDRAKLTLKEIHNCQYVACMNPTAGSFTITQRLQRHFATFSVNFPGMESLQVIYSQILGGHLKSFSTSLQKLGERLVAGALNLHKKVSTVFLPTAVKFHYIFNLRDLSNIFQGILYSKSDLTIKDPIDLIRLWLHEANRTYSDKLVDESDRQQLTKIQEEIIKKSFDEFDQVALKAEPNLYTHFAFGLGEPRYGNVKDWLSMRKILDEAQTSYEESNAAMNLVLFEDAMGHICRINRILESPRGNALLVGVGGSGKQSLSRLAAFISSMEVFQITLKKGYNINDLKVDLGGLYMNAGVKKTPVMFLLTDSQIADEKFLVLINDLLASGNIPGLFADDEVENIINAMRAEAKTAGIIDTREACWDLFIKTVRKNLKVVLCFSPVGNALRSRCRKFPAIVNCTMIDWFQEWPEEALISVAERFISSFELVPDEFKPDITKFMAYAHKSVNDISKKFLINDKRYNYTTPKSFLALIALYKEMLEKKAKDLSKSTDRLENGLTKLQSTAAQVDDLKAKLAFQEVELKQKNDEANRLIEIVGIDTEKVNGEKAIAAKEEIKVAQITKEVTEFQIACEHDLKAAEPALAAATEALNTLNKSNLTELKSFGSPSDDVVNTLAAVMVLLSPAGKIAKNRTWKASKNMMAKVDAFLDQLINFNKEKIDISNLEALKPYLEDPNFNADFMKSKSIAAAGLCSWVVNIVGFYHVFCDVEPKRKALEGANADLETAQTKLAGIKSKIADLDASLADLRAQFEAATAAKLRCEEEAKNTQETIALANRLVGGLASEKVRWGETVAKFKIQEKTLPGDVLLSAAFVSYVGCFSKKYREELLKEHWIPYFKPDKGVKIPITDNFDPMDVLTNSSEVAKWSNEALPNDRISIENAVMLTNCKRWPLIIDPQLQGITWVKCKEGENLKVVRLGARGYLDQIEKAVSAGDTVLIEDIGESIDPVLNSLLGRETIKKGKYIKMGDKEVEYDNRFKLILQTRNPNPHYPPETQAQTTLINFTVTLVGLEDQLLADVVNIERPDLEATKDELTKQQNDFKIRLTELEDALLARLSSAQGNFLGDTTLVESLEITKRTALDIEQKVEEAKKTEKKINETRELYRPVAARSSLLYFLLNDLWQIHPMYQYSLNAFKVVFKNAINRAEPSEDIKERINSLIDSISHMIYIYTTRGLFEKDKLIFAAQMAFQILMSMGEIEYPELDFLLRAPRIVNINSPVDFFSHSTWGMIKALSNLEAFKSLSSDIEGSSKQWKKFCELETPETEKLPQEWKNKTLLQKLCILRCIRPDRMTYAVKNYIGAKLGQRYIDSSRVPLTISFKESGPATPVFFILSPGVDPVKEVEALGRSMGIGEDHKNYHYVSLGQGQEIIAEQKLDLAFREGGWVMLENIHLVAKWLPSLEKKLEALSIGANENFRVFLSAEPAGDPAYHIMPTSILQASIKITNEPPTGMNANIHRALDNFSQESLERCSKDAEYRSIVFALCYFHAVVLERRKFGSQGWNKSYPFSTGDLTISVDVLFNYLETFTKVPWTDLRYMFGDVMYGGHISDDWDRRLCSAYFEVYVREDLMESGFEFAPGFVAPPVSDLKDYHRYIDENLPAESPYLYGLHPNAEIGVLTKSGDNLFRTLLEMQPRETASGVTISKEEKIKTTLDEILEKLPEPFNLAELTAKVEDRTPYISVALQECDRMLTLTNEIRTSLRELNLGLKGDLTISESMEALMNALFLNSVPAQWEKLAYPSLQGLASWYADLLQRIKELEGWVAEFQLPSVVWLSGLFNPQSFLTAIMQTTARKMEWPLDRMVLTVDVTKKAREEFSGVPREGAYVHGLYMDGARWDGNSGMIQESLMKELTPSMPVMYIKAIPIDKRDMKGIYECPLYRTRQRGPTYIWTFNLKTKEKPQKWILAGVSLLCNAE